MLARCSAQEASLASLLADIRNVGVRISDLTLRVYLNALRRLYVITDIEAWAPNLRSKTPLAQSAGLASVRSVPCSSFIGLQCAGPAQRSEHDELSIRDLRVYARPPGGRIYHYRDKNGLEADAVIRLHDGRWAGIEVKFGGKDRIEEGVGNLLSLLREGKSRKDGGTELLDGTHRRKVCLYASRWCACGSAQLPGALT